jgi:hypothetical protein
LIPKAPIDRAFLLGVLCARLRHPDECPSLERWPHIMAAFHKGWASERA